MSKQASKVFFTSLRTVGSESLLDKLARLCKRAGIEKMDLRDKYVAIKMHFGEPGNVAFLRPNYARVMVDLVKAMGGKPFLVDCNTLYPGPRRNALSHLDAAYTNGFSPFATDCHVLIGDGLKGTDDVAVPIDGEYVRAARIGRAVMDADVIISLTHFKAHEGTGFGGALKNIGMGCGSTEGKRDMHESEKPAVDRDGCVACETCLSHCAHGALSMQDGKAFINAVACAGCGRCIQACPQKVIRPMNERANEILARKVAEYAYAVVKDKPQFHVSLLMDVSPFCDCYDHNDAPIIPDVGMFASFDAVALDQACADAANKQPVLHDSLLGDAPAHKDHFTALFADTNWQAGLEQGEKMGLGTRKYELTEI